MRCWKPTTQPTGAVKLRIEPSDVGMNVFIWLDKDSPAPGRDHLQDTLKMAKQSCAEDYRTPAGNWGQYNAPAPLTELRN